VVCNSVQGRIKKCGGEDSVCCRIQVVMLVYEVCVYD